MICLFGDLMLRHQRIGKISVRMVVSPLHKTRWQMTDSRPKLTRSRTAFGMAELVYHSVVRDIRKTHRNAVMGLLLNILQTVIFVAAFYLMFSILGVRGSGIHQADFMVYIMTGIFLFLVHTKTMAAVVRSEGPTSPMMQHAPLNTMVSISAAAISSLYIQLLSLFVVLFLYHAIFTPVHIDDPAGAMAMVFLSWFSGVAVGMIFLAIKPWLPEFVQIATSIYARANMVASGKMFVANSLPTFMLAMFSWNPLFHAIDQARGYAFINYIPHNSNLTYPIVLSIILFMIGMMGEFYTRKHASASWNAAR